MYIYVYITNLLIYLRIQTILNFIILCYSCFFVHYKGIYLLIALVTLIPVYEDMLSAHELSIKPLRLNDCILLRERLYNLH